jgi:hypothetical protein
MKYNLEVNENNLGSLIFHIGIASPSSTYLTYKSAPFNFSSPTSVVIY